MKRIKNILRSTAVIAAAILLVNTASAQRREGGGGQMPRMNGGGMSRPERPMPSTVTGSQASPRQHFNQIPTGGIKPVRPDNFPQQNPRTNFPQQNTPRPPRPTVTQAPPVQPRINQSPRQNYRPQPSPSSTARNYGYGNRNGYHNSGYRNYRRPVVVNRFYYGGAYHPHPVYYRPFTPRFGIHINILPVGYYPFNWSNNRYFYNDGIFYQPYDGYYQTIVPPLGAYVPGIPGAAYPVLINGVNYYEYQGTYYQRVYGAASDYEVVGVNGYLKSDLPPDSDDGDIISDASISSSSAAQLPLTELPSTFKTVTLNNIVYHVSPAGEYYTKNIDDSGKITYQVAAIETKGDQ